MGHKEYTLFSGLPKRVLCSAGLIALSNSQPSLWHHRRPITSLPAVSVRPAKTLTHMELLSVHPKKCFIHDQQFAWHRRLFMPRSKQKKLWPQTDLHSLDCLGWIESHCLSLRLLPLFLRSPVPIWSYVPSSWKVPGMVQVLQPTVDWMQRVGRQLTGHAGSSERKTRVA